MKFIYLSFFLLLLTSGANAQKWNVDSPPGPYKKVSFTLDEGTWMDLDVSPDTQKIVFDLLGDIYSIPIKGGRATLLAGGKAWEVQPRYSPDGKFISYTSDKGGQDNIWIMNSDGSDKHQITNEPGGVSNASWTPDGQFVAARKQVANAGEIWLYPKSGGDGIRLITGNGNKSDGEPVVSPDGKFIYWSEAKVKNGALKVTDPNKGIYAIKSLNRETGEIKTVSGVGGGACRPQISPDGKLMAFVKRVRLQSVLCLRNINTGEEWAVYDDLSHDQQETPGVFGVYPNFSWTPDSKNLVFYAKGKIWNLGIDSLNITQVPFEASSQQIITDALHCQQKVFTDDFTVRSIRQLTTSPDGKKIAFSAAGYIYIKALPDSVPVRITSTSDFEYSPEFSPDGKSLIYVDWSDELKASINKVDLTTHMVTRLTTEKGFYFTPRFSKKGDKIIFSKGAGNDVLGFAFGENPGIYMMPATGGTTPKLVVDNGSDPRFTANDSKIYYQTSNDGKIMLMTADTTGANRQVLYTSNLPARFNPSPDGKWLAFTQLSNCYLTPMINTGSPQELSAGHMITALTKLSADVGTSPHWSTDSKKVMWVSGPRYYACNVNNTADTTGINIGLKLESDVPQGEIAFKNARLITMKGDQVIENGTIVIKQNKITEIGKADDVQIPPDAKVYDMSGKTIMPGIIDVDAHLNPSPNGISPQQDWNYYANLAYGVTTVLDQSVNNALSFTQSEMLKAGYMVGPRVFPAGEFSYGASGDDMSDAVSAMRRLKTEGAFAVKCNNQLNREQRQQIIDAAHSLQMDIIPGTHTNFFTGMSMILDGYSAVQHNIPVWPVYSDVKSLWNDSKTAYTPTLMVSTGTQPGENYWYDRLEVWKDEHLLNFMPQYIIDARSRRRTTSDYGDYGHIEISKYVKQLADGGTKVNVGSNGELQGLGAHWEMWMLAQGGMAPLDVLQCATINGAYYLGMEKEIGSLETGKLADLIILNENPLDDIRNSETIKYVMVNGRLYDTDSMNEIGNEDKPRLHFWWQMNHSETISLPFTEDGE